MRGLRSLPILLLLLGSGIGAGALTLPPKPVPQRLVCDYAGILTRAQANSLEMRLVAFDDSTSNQIALVTVSDLEGEDPNWYAAQLGRAWGVGGEKDNGIVLLVKPKNSSGYGEVAIQVGYGLEGAIPDAYCKRIIDNVIIPRFKDDDYYGGITDGIEELAALASGEISEPRDGGEDEGFWTLIAFLIILAFIVFVILMIAGSHNNDGSNGGGGGDANRRSPIIIIGGSGPILGGGSSFGGGGGFGGFGGGSFGGGGASGRW